MSSRTVFIADSQPPYRAGLRSVLEAAGLEVEQLAGDHELGPLEPGSDRVVLVARKP